MKYYPIDEDAARRAKDMNSLSDYAEGVGDRRIPARC